MNFSINAPLPLTGPLVARLLMTSLLMTGVLQAAEPKSTVTSLMVVPPPTAMSNLGGGQLGDGGLRVGTAFEQALWDDGLAEVADYDLQQFRYGNLHPGTATLIVVRENLDPERVVKAGANAKSSIPVLKCHLIRSFQTGVYRYEQAVTTFVRRDDAVALRLFINSHEWCGSAAKSWINRGPDSTMRVMSYFDGHGDLQQPLTLNDTGVLADSLAVWLRAWLATSAAPTDVALIPSQLEARTVSTAPEIVRLSRTAMGDTDVVTVTGPQSRQRFVFSHAAPQVLQRWECADGTTLTLKNVRRFDYWAHHNPKDRNP